MKTGKKVLCTLLALIVAFVSFCPAVLAEPAPAAAITVTGFEANNVTYQVYPILEPTANWQNNTAGAFQWADWVGNGFLPSSPLAGTTVQDFLAYENSAEPIRTFAEQAKSYVTRNGVAPARSGAVSGSALRLENLTAGSYLLLFADTGTTLYSPMILSLAPQVSNGAWVLNDVTAVVKKSTPAIVKEVKKVSEGEEGYSTSQSASIGDTMQYRITASVPVYGSDYSIVTYRITDEMSAGLSYQGNLAVYGEAGGTLTPLRDGVDYTFTLASAQNFTVEFTYENLLPYSNVVITFHALINEQAQVDTGNPNTATLFFDNQTYTFTASQQANITLYQVDIEKQDAANGNGLPGAVFTLARREGGTDTTLGMVQTGDGVYRPAVGAESAQTDLTTGTAGPGQLALVGLGSGVYVLTETRAPDGYATPQGESAKTVFEIRHSESPTLVLNNNETLSANNNHFTFKILNNTGFTLPVTGGTGSLLFYGAGICVFALAIVLAVKWNKKK